MKVLGFYHRADFDGRMCAAILLGKYGNSIELIGVDYGDDYSRYVDKAREKFWDKIIVCDFCFPREINKSMAEQAITMLVIDHHKGIEEKVVNISNCSLVNGFADYDLAACEITFISVVGGRVIDIPIAIRLTGQYDRFRKNCSFNTWETALSFQYYLRTIDPSTSELRDLIFNQESLSLALTIGGNVLKYEMSNIQRLANEQSFDISLDKKLVRAINYNGSPSLLADFIFEFDDEYYVEVVMTYHELPDRRWKLSFRSTKDRAANCLMIAKHYGGGGHENAGGAIVDFETIKQILKWT